MAERKNASRESRRETDYCKGWPAIIRFPTAPCSVRTFTGTPCLPFLIFQQHETNGPLRKTRQTSQQTHKSVRRPPNPWPFITQSSSGGSSVLTFFMAVFQAHQKKNRKKSAEYLDISKKLPTFAPAYKKQGRLAQLVQSVCLTSRGSAVRIRQRPQQNPAALRWDCRIFFYAHYTATPCPTLTRHWNLSGNPVASQSLNK